MKKVVLFLLIILCSIASAQKYKFDFILNTETFAENNIKNKEQSTILFSEKDQSYDLRIFKNGAAVLYDFKKNEKHNFEVVLDVYTNNTNFEYLDTEEIYLKNHRNSYEILNTTDLDYVVKVFHGKKAKTPYITFKVKLKESTDNVIAVSAHMNIISLREIATLINSKLDKNKKFAAESTIVIYENGRVTRQNYKNHEKINLTIEIKNKNIRRPTSFPVWDF